MKLLTTTFTLLSLLSSAPAQSADAASAVSRANSRSISPAPAENFTGSARVEMLFSATPPARTSAGSVTFQPGARTAWHTHPLGQRLIVTAGIGRMQFWGGPVQEIHPGDVVWIPPGQKHWHGATPNAAMTHIAIQEQLDGKTVDWLEKVTDVQYHEAKTETAQPAAAAAATPAQRQFGDIAPKFAELTDKVLFGDVWERPGLNKRDRSLVTVSALIAMNRPDQLRPHLTRARDNGVTHDELVETITHLAFYAGWPSAVTAASVAKETLSSK